MMTPQEVSEHAFTKASFGGYNMAMVDEFLDVLTADYTSLYKENAVLKSKMKILVDKVEDYRSTEDAMRKTLLTAQKMADTMLDEAEAKKAEILTDATNQVKAKFAELQQDVDSEVMRLAAARSATAGYVDKLKELYQHEMAYLSTLGNITAPLSKVDPVSRAAQEIQASVEKIMAADAPSLPTDPEDTRDLDLPSKREEDKPGGLYQELLELNLRRSGPSRIRAQEPEPDPQEQSEDSSPTRRIDFDNLQFGREYEIK